MGLEPTTPMRPGRWVGTMATLIYTTASDANILRAAVDTSRSPERAH
jgi:hypothetical protein